jgi:signal peptidase I
MAVIFAALTLALVQPRWLPSNCLDPADFEVGQVVVPTLATSRWRTSAEWERARAEMFSAGLYPGVDYVVARRAGGREMLLSVQPAYPLKAKLEREWPVVVDASVAPRWMDPVAYNLLTAGFAVGTALAGLLLALLLSTTLTLSVVPSGSMEPAVMPRDVLFVEKVRHRLGCTTPRGSLVLFRPPPALQTIVRGRAAEAGANGGSGAAAAAERLLFVKRVVAVAGDSVSIDAVQGVSVNGHSVGPAISPGSQLASLTFAAKGDVASGSGVEQGRGARVVPAGAYFVLGDNADVSVDSWCWGFLPAESVAGRPLLRVLPLARLGPVADR